ncbi:hypothetical protein Aduo_000097 [Ancylostoma duodenale]
MIVANQLERHAIEADPVLVGRGDQPAQLHTSKVRGKNAPQYLDKGTLLSKKYRLEKMIGGGGFGQIYRATDIDMGTVVAAKVEPQSEDAGRMVLEQMVLTKLVGTRHSPRLKPSLVLLVANHKNSREVCVARVTNARTHDPAHCQMFKLDNSFSTPLDH